MPPSISKRLNMLVMLTSKFSDGCQNGYKAEMSFVLVMDPTSLQFIIFITAEAAIHYQNVFW